MRTVIARSALRDVVDVRAGADVGSGVAVRAEVPAMRAGREVTPQIEATRAILPTKAGSLH